jgi:hypothetical protein
MKFVIICEEIFPKNLYGHSLARISLPDVPQGIYLVSVVEEKKINQQ